MSSTECAECGSSLAEVAYGDGPDPVCGRCYRRLWIVAHLVASVLTGDQYALLVHGMSIHPEYTQQDVHVLASLVQSRLDDELRDAEVRHD